MRWRPAAGNAVEGGTRDRKEKPKVEHDGSACRREMRRGDLGGASDHGGREEAADKVARSLVSSEGSEEELENSER